MTTATPDNKNTFLIENLPDRVTDFEGYYRHAWQRDNNYSQRFFQESGSILTRPVAVAEYPTSTFPAETPKKEMIS
jgi:hypothetical protein